MSYDSFIEQARFVGKVESITTGGDIEYEGTALEIWDEQGEELFHIVVNTQGEREILFLAKGKDYRLPLKLMEEILSKAREVVKRV